MFAAMRFFTGFGISGISIISIVLCKLSVTTSKKLEWVGIKHRTLVGVLMSLDWSFSTTLLPGVAYFVNDWRYLTATVTSPLLPAIICWWLPESARWLISTGKVNSAHFYLTKCAKLNRREEFMILSKVILVEDENRKYSYMDLVKTPKMRRLALLTGIVWFGVACVYYGISLNVPGFGVDIYLTQFIYAISEIPGKIFIIFFLNKLGRRWTQAGTLGFTGLCLFCNIFLFFFLFISDMWIARTAFGAAGKMFAEAAFTTVFLYTTELYPTVMRQNGLGFSSFAARTGVSLSPLVMILEDVKSYLPNIIFTLVACIASVSTSFLPETLNVRLPETIEDIEQTRSWSDFGRSRE
uniref:Uncharacterized protein n=1 Tax=Poecilia mexicana TaxID=48701 RepID=A0A3B3XN79_9TELE